MNDISVNAKMPKRIIPVIASIAIQMCLGTAYIWSVFQSGVATRLFGGDNASAALTFSLLLAVLTIGSTIGGKINDKIGPRPVIIIGGVILSVGFFLSSLVTEGAPWLLWLTYGIIGGIGMGFIYSTSIACCQKWYPEKRGLIGGVVVSALGFGGVIFTPIAEALIKSLGGGVAGVGELKTFALLALIFIIVCTVGGIFLVNPPEGFNPKNYKPAASKSGVINQQFSPSEMLKMPQFYIICGTFMLACMAGLMMIGFAKPIAIAKNIDAADASLGVMIISIFNSFGRLFWGGVSDKLGTKKTLLLLLAATAVIIMFVNFVSGILIFATIALIGFAYGGLLGTFPAITAEYFGSKNMGSNYGFVLLGFGIGAVASSYIAGHFKNLATEFNDISRMFPAFIIAAVAAVIGIALLLMLKPPKAKNQPQ